MRILADPACPANFAGPARKRLKYRRTHINGGETGALGRSEAGGGGNGTVKYHKTEGIATRDAAPYGLMAAIVGAGLVLGLSVVHATSVDLEGTKTTVDAMRMDFTAMDAKVLDNRMGLENTKSAVGHMAAGIASIKDSIVGIERTQALMCAKLGAGCN